LTLIKWLVNTFYINQVTLVLYEINPLDSDKDGFSVKFYQKLAIFCKKKELFLFLGGWGLGTGDWGLGRK
jgi:hypothetical protein